MPSEQCKHISRKERPETKVNDLPITCHLLTCQNIVPRRLLYHSKHKDKDKAFSNLIACQNVKVSPPRLLDPRECAASQVGSCLGGGEPFLIFAIINRTLYIEKGGAHFYHYHHVSSSYIVHIIYGKAEDPWRRWRTVSFNSRSPLYLP